MGYKEKGALTSPNTLCAYLSPLEVEEKSLLSLALFNLTQLVEQTESIENLMELGPTCSPESDAVCLGHSLKTFKNKNEILLPLTPKELQKMETYT